MLGFWLLGNDQHSQPGLIPFQPKVKRFGVLAACGALLWMNRQYLVGFGNTENRPPTPTPIFEEPGDPDGLTPGILRVEARQTLLSAAALFKHGQCRAVTLTHIHEARHRLV